MIWILGKGEHELGLEKGGWRTGIPASLGNLFFFFFEDVFYFICVSAYEFVRI